MARLSSKLERWASQPLEPGQGLHLDIFRATIIMLEQGYPDPTVFEFIRRAADTVPDRHVPDRELHGAIRYAKARLAGEAGSLNTWPKFEQAYRAEVVTRHAVDLRRLAAASAKLPTAPFEYMKRIYGHDEFVCLGRTAFEFGTQRVGEWYEPLQYYEYEYISPNPMKFEWGFTKDNEPSMHCLDNCGPKIFQVVEFDFGTTAEHAAILKYLAQKMPLILIVYSGGKSLHGWFNVKGRAEEHVLAFFKDAVTLGADPKMWSPVQFSRLPGGTNSKHQRHQSVVVWQPQNL